MKQFLEKLWTKWSTLGMVSEDEMDEIAIRCLEGGARENYANVIIKRIAQNPTKEEAPSP